MSPADATTGSAVTGADEGTAFGATGLAGTDFFDAAAFGLAEANPVHAVSASYAVADIAMPELRYLVDPSQPPLKAVERL